MPSTSQITQPFTSNGDVSILVKKYRVGQKTKPIKQRNDWSYLELDTTRKQKEADHKFASTRSGVPTLVHLQNTLRLPPSIQYYIAIVEFS